MKRTIPRAAALALLSFFVLALFCFGCAPKEPAITEAPTSDEWTTEPWSATEPDTETEPETITEPETETEPQTLPVANTTRAAVTTQRPAATTKPVTTPATQPTTRTTTQTTNRTTTTSRATTNYIVSFNANGGANAPASIVGYDITLPSQSGMSPKAYAVTFDTGGITGATNVTLNCTFNGWREGSTIGKLYAGGAQYTPSASTTLYADWKNPQLGTLPADPVRDGYAFDGWYTSATGGIKASVLTTVSANTTYYAQWKQCAVTFNANGGGNAPATLMVAPGTSITLPDRGDMASKKYQVTFDANGGQPTSTISYGCGFGGWRFSTATSAIVYAAGSRYTPYGNVTFYAKWDDPYVIGYPGEPTREGFTFQGWYTSATGGAKVTSSTVVSANTTYYARWA